MHKIAFYSIKCSGGREFCLTIQFSCPTVRCTVAYCYAIAHFRANGKNRTHGSKATLHVPPPRPARGGVEGLSRGRVSQPLGLGDSCPKELTTLMHQDAA